MVQSAPALLLLIAVVSSALPSVSASFYGGSSEPREMAYGPRHAYYPRSSSGGEGTKKDFDIKFHPDHGKTSLLDRIRRPQLSAHGNVYDSIPKKEQWISFDRPHENGSGEVHHKDHHTSNEPREMAYAYYPRSPSGRGETKKKDIKPHPDHGKTTLTDSTVRNQHDSQSSTHTHGHGSDSTSPEKEREVRPRENDSGEERHMHHHRTVKPSSAGLYRREKNYGNFRRASEEMYGRTYYARSDPNIKEIKDVRDQTGVGLVDAKGSVKKRYRK